MVHESYAPRVKIGTKEQAKKKELKETRRPDQTPLAAEGPQRFPFGEGKRKGGGLRHERRKGGVNLPAKREKGTGQICSKLKKVFRNGSFGKKKTWT